MNKEIKQQKLTEETIEELRKRLPNLTDVDVMSLLNLLLNYSQNPNEK